MENKYLEHLCSIVVIYQLFGTYKNEAKNEKKLFHIIELQIDYKEKLKNTKMENKYLEHLCSIVVIYQLFGTYKNEAKKAMKELNKNRENGSDFNFENWISLKKDQIKKESKIIAEKQFND
jgi:hypothetical protein